MKTLNRIICALGLLAALATGVFAQETLTADVPFSFNVSNKVMPAGFYTIQRVRSLDNQLLAIHGEGTSALAISHVENQSNQNPVLVFRQIGDEKVLVRIEGPYSKHEFPLSKKQKLALSKNAEAEQIMVALNR